MSAPQRRGDVLRQILEAKDPLRPLPDFKGTGEDDWDFDFEGSTIGDWWGEPEPTPIYDSIVLESLLAAAPRPSLWTRIAAWFR